MMSEKKRLHPVAMLLAFLASLKEVALPLIIFVFIGRGGEGYSWWHFLIMGAFLLFTLGNGVLSWWFYTYQIRNNELQIHQGFIFRKKRFIPRERVQSIDTSQGVIQRIFGLVKVQIETAGGGGEPEVVMSALSRFDAEQLRSELYKSRRPEEAEETFVNEPPVKEYRLSKKDLIIAASTSGGIGVFLSFIAAIGSQVDNILPDEFYSIITERVMDATLTFILVIALIVLLLSWIFSVLGTVLKYGGFVLSRTEDDLIIKRGILERRQLTIPVQRVQAIRVVEGLLRQPFGYATIYVESGGGGGKDEQFSTILFPLLKRKRIQAFLEELIPEVPVHQELTPLPRKARIRYMIRFMLPSLIPALLITYFVPFGYLSFSILPVACFLGYLHHKDAGWSIKDTTSLLQFRQIGRVRVYVPRKRIQAMELNSTLFQKRKSLTTIQVSILSSLAGKQFRVRDIELLNGHDLLNWYSYNNSIKKQTDE
ncbi:PH domain-containing protein [Alkalihalobacillus sp. CinArs1]|uniref:PH domain-containing protein n=1 Tax=Alkalihalobacillus sp. CinArs1 TaxID=2995314 RepID=UPI0022DDA90A|nr:PH domain-containing protein [Alkalihalobacillus sp. CinArs1]